MMQVFGTHAVTWKATWHRTMLVALILAALGRTSGAVEVVESCPAGPAGDSCRANVLLLRRTPTWSVFEGCAIPAGDDIGEAEWVSTDEAKELCGAVDSCVGFTHEGAQDEVGPMWVHLKSSFDCVDAEWTSYRKVAPGRVAEVPAPTSPQRGNDSQAGEMVVSRSADEEGEGVALCLTGQVRMLSATHRAMEQNLLSVLQPDVFLYGPRQRGAADGSPELYGLADYVAEARWEEEDIRANLYRQTRNAGRVIDLEYVDVQGNWFGNQCLQPPLRDSRPGSAVCFYYNQHRCLDMIERMEDKRGLPYRTVVVSRFDFRWMAPHPPLDLLIPDDAVWIPSGSDWEGGLNDRHAVMPRHLADAYLSGWSLLTSGQAREVMLDTLGSMKVNGYPGPNTENFLKARLLHFNVSTERFPSVAYLTCTQRDKSRWTQCSGTATNDHPGWLYKEEMEHATSIAKCVRSQWSAKKMKDCAEDITHLYRGFR